MPPARYTSPFAPLALTLDEKEKLRRMAEQIVGERMAMYERFVRKDKGQVDPLSWAMICEHEQTRAYQNVIVGAGTGNRDMQLLLTIGTVPGTVHDVMYGAITPTTDAYRIKAAYAKDTAIDMAVLESIIEPTPERPCETLSVRWGVKGVPTFVRFVAKTKHQDCVYLESSGLRQLSNGERVGIQLVQSVTFDKTPVLPQYNRVNTSVCTIWRQKGPDMVQGYMVTYLEKKDSFATNLVIKSMAEASMTMGNVVECAELKKLTWLMQHKAARGHNDADAGRSTTECCSVCSSQDRSARRGRKSACAICTKSACDKCRVKRTLCVVSHDSQLLKHELRVCRLCLASSRKLDAMTVAQAEVSGGYARSVEDCADLDTNSSYCTWTTASVTSSQSGDEVWLPKHRSDSSSYSDHKRGKARPYYQIGVAPHG